MRFRIAALVAAGGFLSLGVYDCQVGDFHCAAHALFGMLTALVAYAEAGAKKLPTK